MATLRGTGPALHGVQKALADFVAETRQQLLAGLQGPSAHPLLDLLTNFGLELIHLLFQAELEKAPGDQPGASTA
ncbi:MAG: hypothetical protein ACPHCJ_08405, partial [Oceanococcaceae bacterium]